jgi:hypothetical protein
LVSSFFFPFTALSSCPYSPSLCLSLSLSPPLSLSLSMFLLLSSHFPPSVIEMQQEMQKSKEEDGRQGKFEKQGRRVGLGIEMMIMEEG